MVLHGLRIFKFVESIFTPSKNSSRKHCNKQKQATEKFKNCVLGSSNVENQNQHNIISKRLPTNLNKTEKNGKASIEKDPKKKNYLSEILNNFGLRRRRRRRNVRKIRTKKERFKHVSQSPQKLFKERSPSSDTRLSKVANRVKGDRKIDITSLDQVSFKNNSSNLYSCKMEYESPFCRKLSKAFFRNKSGSYKCGPIDESSSKTKCACDNGLGHFNILNFPNSNSIANSSNTVKPCSTHSVRIRKETKSLDKISVSAKSVSVNTLPVERKISKPKTACGQIKALPRTNQRTPKERNCKILSTHPKSQIEMIDLTARVCKNSKFYRINKKRRKKPFFAYFAAKVFSKLQRKPSFFVEDQSTTKKVLNCILFSFIVIAWAPCIIAVACSWYLSNPLRTKFLSTENSRYEINKKERAKRQKSARREYSSKTIKLTESHPSPHRNNPDLASKRQLGSSLTPHCNSISTSVDYSIWKPSKKCERKDFRCDLPAKYSIGIVTTDTIKKKRKHSTIHRHHHLSGNSKCFIKLQTERHPINQYECYCAMFQTHPQNHIGDGNFCCPYEECPKRKHKSNQMGDSSSMTSAAVDSIPDSKTAKKGSQGMCKSLECRYITNHGGIPPQPCTCIAKMMNEYQSTPRTRRLSKQGSIGKGEKQLKENYEDNPRHTCACMSKMMKEHQSPCQARRQSQSIREREKPLKEATKLSPDVIVIHSQQEKFKNKKVNASGAKTSVKGVQCCPPKPILHNHKCQCKADHICFCFGEGDEDQGGGGGDTASGKKGGAAAGKKKSTATRKKGAKAPARKGAKATGKKRGKGKVKKRKEYFGKKGAKNRAKELKKYKKGFGKFVKGAKKMHASKRCKFVRVIEGKVRSRFCPRKTVAQKMGLKCCKCLKFVGRLIFQRMIEYYEYRKASKKKKTFFKRLYHFVCFPFRKTKFAILAIFDLFNETNGYITKVDCDTLYIHALRDRPCFWVYRKWPKLYPYFLYYRKSFLRCMNILMIIMATFMWIPIVMSCYLFISLLRACLCN